MRLSSVLAATLLLAAAPLHAAFDYQWAFTATDTLSYRMNAAPSSPLVYNGAIPAQDPTINLIVGKRYRITNQAFSGHPFEIRALRTGDDVVLLSQNSGTNPALESDTGIAWAELANGVVEFTVTPTLVTALTQGGRTPGYACNRHPSSMRGTFVIFGGGAPIVDPIPGGIPASKTMQDVEIVAQGLVSPVGIAEAPDGSGRLFVTDQIGDLRIIDADGVLLEEPALSVRSRMPTLGIPAFFNYDERGFLGFAFHPNFATNGKVYTYTSEPADSGTADFAAPAMAGNPLDHHAVIAEWTVSGSNANVIDPSSRRELLRVEEPQFNHNGGAMHFGNDGFLYISFGDGGGADDQDDNGGTIGHDVDGNGQNPATILGTIIRIDVNGTNSANGHYGIPPSNPFAASSTNVKEIYCYGLRNPYNFTIDPVTGNLWIGDVGQNAIEEIDLGASGANYGWRLKEGTFFFDAAGVDAGFVTNVATQPILATLTEPVAQYDHDEGTALICGPVYRGTALPDLAGQLIFADFGSFAGPSGRIFRLAAGNQIEELFFGHDNMPLGLWVKGMGRDAEGEVYICASPNLGLDGTGGTVLRLSDHMMTVPDGDTWVVY